MTKIVIATAGNTLAPCLAVLRSQGYRVARVPGEESLLEAVDGSTRLLAQDPMQLLGLATLAAHRGADWRPTDAEIADWRALDASPPP